LITAFWELLLFVILLCHAQWWVSIRYFLPLSKNTFTILALQEVPFIFVGSQKFVDVHFTWHDRKYDFYIRSLWNFKTEVCNIIFADNSYDLVHFRYNSLDQLTCSLCNVIVKSDALWVPHIQSRQHKEVINLNFVLRILLARKKIIYIFW
jgi:hypothetical protein